MKYGHLSMKKAFTFYVSVVADPVCSSKTTLARASVVIHAKRSVLRKGKVLPYFNNFAKMTMERKKAARTF